MSEEPVYADDLVVGARWELGTYEVTESAIVGFAADWDPQWFHVDAPAAAERSPFGGVIASGLHSLAILQRLSVLGAVGRWAVIAGRRMTNIEFRAPVRPGDVLDGWLVVEAIEVGQGRALITYSCGLVNRSGRLVLRADVEAYVRTRPLPSSA
ncbi:MAG: MaoC/PaaZ C-terminal domain-containing protein [Gordonia sp. (in: high G+C Gram-positive bacteria)]